MMPPVPGHTGNSLVQRGRQSSSAKCPQNRRLRNEGQQPLVLCRYSTLMGPQDCQRLPPPWISPEADGQG